MPYYASYFQHYFAWLAYSLSCFPLRPASPPGWSFICLDNYFFAFISFDIWFHIYFHYFTLDFRNLLLPYTMFLSKPHATMLTCTLFLLSCLFHFIASFTSPVNSLTPHWYFWFIFFTIFDICALRFSPIYLFCLLYRYAFYIRHTRRRHANTYKCRLFSAEFEIYYFISFL